MASSEHNDVISEAAFQLYIVQWGGVNDRGRVAICFKGGPPIDLKIWLMSGVNVVEFEKRMKI